MEFSGCLMYTVRLLTMLVIRPNWWEDIETSVDVRRRFMGQCLEWSRKHGFTDNLFTARVIVTFHSAAATLNVSKFLMSVYHVRHRFMYQCVDRPRKHEFMFWNCSDSLFAARFISTSGLAAAILNFGCEMTASNIGSSDFEKHDLNNQRVAVEALSVFHQRNSLQRV